MMYRDHYWFIGADRALYSSARNVLVEPDDGSFLAWKAAGGWAVPIASFDELASVLLTQAPGHLPEWLFNAPTFVQPAEGVYTPAQLIAFAASLRFERENAGIEVDDMFVATDDRSKIMIAGARTAADSDPDFTTPWAAGATIRMLSAGEIIAISNAVLAHVRAAFAAFASAAQRISTIPAGLTTLDDVRMAMALPGK